MKNFSQITENLDVANKKYIDDGLSKCVTLNTTQTITGKKTFTNTIVKKSTTIDLNNKPTTGTQWNYIEFTDKNDDRIGIAGSRFDAGGYAGVYLQARNSQQLWIASSTPDSNGNTVTKTSTPTPPATDDSTQIANTSWVRTNYQEKGYAGIDGAVLNADGKVTDKDGNVVDALYFKVASLTTEKAYMRTYLLAEVAMTNIVKEQATVLIRCTTESSTSAPNVTITFDNYSYASLLLPKNIFVTADYKSGTAGATFTVWVKQDKDFMQQVWNVLSQNTRNYTTTSKREWRVFYSNITKASAVTDINAAPTGYTRIVANNNNRYSNLEENTYLWQQSNNAGIRWKRYSDNTERGVFRLNDDGTTGTFVTQSDMFLFRPLDNNNTKSIKVDTKIGALYPEKNLGADLGKTAQRWLNGYITNLQNVKVINGGGGNSLIQQDSDTAGADITVGSTNCALKMLGKSERPTYRQGKNGTYANLALQSDIKNGTLTIQKNGSNVATFTANQSGSSTANITVPAQVAYGTCETAAGTAAKIVTVSDTTWTLTVGTIVGVKFTNTNTASNVTINVNGTGAKSIWYNNAKQTGNSNLYAGYANRLIYYMYDGTYWCWVNAGTEADTIPSGMSWTGGSTKDKAATCHNYSLLAKSYTQVIMISSNTAKSALTLNINGKGKKPIYINGAASSATNYTLPAGSYFVYYDGTNYYFRTDGKFTVGSGLAMTTGGTAYTYTLPQANGPLMVGSLSGTTLTITL